MTIVTTGQGGSDGDTGPSTGSRRRGTRTGSSRKATTGGPAARKTASRSGASKASNSRAARAADDAVTAPVAESTPPPQEPAPQEPAPQEPMSEAPEGAVAAPALPPEAVPASPATPPAAPVVSESPPVSAPLSGLGQALAWHQQGLQAWAQGGAAVGQGLGLAATGWQRLAAGRWYNGLRTACALAEARSLADVVAAQQGYVSGAMAVWTQEVQRLATESVRLMASDGAGSGK